MLLTLSIIFIRLSIIPAHLAVTVKMRLTN